jgi:predicted dehydrogenase
MDKKIGVGIIGFEPNRSFSAIAHVPALRSLPDYEIRAVSTTRMQSAKAASAAINVPLAFDNHRDLISAPGVDLVAVTVKVPYHRELVLAAIEAGKSVYCEWPLGNGLAEAVEMAARAKSKGVKAFVGLQARAAPAINYLRDLIAQGYIGRVLSTTLVGSGMNWGEFIDQPNAYTADKKNGATMLTIPFGHTIDALCYCLGEFTQVAATMACRRETFTLVPDRKKLPMTAEDQVAVSGLLADGTVASIHYRGGVSRGTNLLWEINGTEGDVQITSYGGHAQLFDLALAAGRGEEKTLQPLTIPAKYIGNPELPPFARSVGQAYSRALSDLREGTNLCPTFDDAVVRHRLLDAVERAAQTGNTVRLDGR